MANHPQSRLELEELDSRWYGVKPPRPGKRLVSWSEERHSAEVVRLRVTETREVAELGAAIANVDCPLRGIVVRVVNVVDHLNCIIAGIATPDSERVPGCKDPDFGGLTMGALRTKRATLCLACKRALAEALAGRVVDAETILSEALDQCFPSPGA